MSFVYCLYSTINHRRTYIGATKNVKRRVRQHNGEIKGGAKYTRSHRPWKLAWYIQGFPSWRSALSCEWYIKHYSKKFRGPTKRSLARDQAMKKCGYDGLQVVMC
jgi:structure-specific endonuclease subunit SLX1